MTFDPNLANKVCSLRAIERQSLTLFALHFEQIWYFTSLITRNLGSKQTRLTFDDGSIAFVNRTYIIKIIEIKPLLAMCFEFHGITAFLHFSVRKEVKIILQNVNKSKCNSACNDTEIILNIIFSKKKKNMKISF